MVLDNFLVAASHNTHTLYQTDLSASSSVPNEMLAMPDIANYPFATAYHPEEEKLYWTEDRAGLLRRASLDGTNAESFYLGG